jgi:hypothetical protein
METIGKSSPEHRSAPSPGVAILTSIIFISKIRLLQSEDGMNGA